MIANKPSKTPLLPPADKRMAQKIEEERAL